MNKKILILKENPPKTYLKALEDFGLPFDCGLKYAKNRYCGLLLVGGEDVFPPLYGGNINDALSLNIVRDKIELDAVDFFCNANLPILGICRGLQVLNVYFGGTLKNITCHTGEKDVVNVVKTVDDNEKIFSVNCRHHQAVDRPSENSKVLMRASDGTIECCFFSDKIFGTQFHPERSDEKTKSAVFGTFANLTSIFNERTKNVLRYPK